jgi:hypothetical protein
MMGVPNMVVHPNRDILRLARSGSPERAWALMEQHGLLNSDSDSQALTLQARLVKDRAKRTKGLDSGALFTEAADIYAKAGALTKSSYPLINAATMSLLAGDKVRSKALAREVLAIIEADPKEGETPYWREATRAEAFLLLGDEVEANGALGLGIAKQPEAWEDHAATISQFSLILSHQGRDKGWLDSHRPPISVYFSGLSSPCRDSDRISDAMRHFIATENIGFAYGALAAGADLMFAQAFLKHRDKVSACAELHVILPFRIDRFRETSVLAFGAHWLPIFDDVLAQAASVTILGGDEPPLLLAVESADQVAMGRAIRSAQILESRAVGITVLAQGETLRPPLASWQNSGRPLMIIESQREAMVTDHVEPEVTRLRLSTLIWVSHGNGHDISHILDGQHSAHIQGSCYWLACEDVAEAYQLGTRLALADPRARVSVLVAIFDPSAPSTRLLHRAEALAEASSQGVVCTDDWGAMALTFAGWSGSIGEIGELRTPWGSEAAWRVGSS